MQVTNVMKRNRRGVHFKDGRRKRSRTSKVVGAAVGLVLSATVAYATSWTVGIATNNSGGQGESLMTINGLTISAVASPTPSNLLYPGSTGDVVMSIQNTNTADVTITAFNLPANTSFATGYTASNLTGAVAGCTATTSDVQWTNANGSSGTSVSLTTALVVAPSSTLLVTLTNAATMQSGSPNACQGIYFSMPDLTNLTATALSGTPTSSPTTDTL